MILFEFTPLFLTGAFLLGLLIGSFLNVVIMRLPAMIEYDWRCQCLELLSNVDHTHEPSEGNSGVAKNTTSATSTESPPTLTQPPSRCPKCGHKIRAWENIPLLSYLALGGKCSSCNTRISPRYPFIELLTGLAFLTVAWKFGPTATTAAGLVLTAFLIALSGIDIDTQYLPDNMTLPLMWLGLLCSLPTFFPTLLGSLFTFSINPIELQILDVSVTSSLLGAVFGYLSLWSVYKLFKLVTGKEGMGYGDFKLLAALGAWMGWQDLLPIILISAAVGSIIGIGMMITGLTKRHQTIPFGPYLAIAGWVVFVWGDIINSGFQRLMGFSG